MAKSGSNNVRLNPGGRSLFESRVKWRVVSQSTSGNSSVIEVKTYLYAAYAINMGNRTGSTTISGTSAQSYSYSPGSMSGERLLSTKNFTVKHDSNGSARRTITVKNNIQITYAGYYANVASHSFTIDIDKINRVPNKPSVSISNIGRNSARINWSTNLPVKTMSYRLRPSGGSWTSWTNVTVNNATSGNTTRSGLADGKYYDVEMQLLGQYVSSWTSSGTSSFTTLHASYMSGLRIGPVKGYNNRLVANYSSSATGGTTYIEVYKGGSWVSVANGEHLTGLSNGTHYTFSFRARNSSGVINSYSASGTVYAQPTGSFSVSQANKTSLKISTSSLAHTTSMQYRVNGGSWVGFSNSATVTSGISPGKSYQVEVRLISSTTGITRSLGTKSVSTPALAALTLSISAVSRNTATVAVKGSDALRSISWQVGSGSWQTKNLSGGRDTTIPMTGLKSNTSYTLNVKGVDNASGLGVSQKSITVKTSAFRPPRVSLSSTLTSIVASYTIVDSCTVGANHEGKTIASGVQPAGKVLTYTFTKSTSGATFAANTNYEVWTNFTDEYSANGAASKVSATIRTQPIEDVSVKDTFDLKSVTNTASLPVFDFIFTGSKYKKEITMVLPSGSKKFTVNEGTSSLKISLSTTETQDLVRFMKSLDHMIPFSINYFESGRKSATMVPKTIKITLNNSLLPAPKSSEIAIKYSAFKDMKLSALVDRKINKADVTVSQPKEALLGSTISKIDISFGTDNRSFKTPANPLAFTLGPYDRVPHVSMKVTYTDSRGLVSSNSFPVSQFTYRPPTIEVAGASRIDGFSKDLTAKGILVSYDVPPVASGIKNTIPGIEIRYRTGVETGEGALYKTVSISDQTVVTNNKARYPGKGVATLTLLEDPKLGVFSEDTSYELDFYVKDYFSGFTGEFGVTKEVRVPTGIPIMFMDTINKRVGVQTTAPRASFEVSGDGIFKNIYSLNGLFFFDTDVEELVPEPPEEIPIEPEEGPA